MKKYELSHVEIQLLDQLLRDHGHEIASAGLKDFQEAYSSLRKKLRFWSAENTVGLLEGDLKNTISVVPECETSAVEADQ